jgi:hypothetical protein
MQAVCSRIPRQRRKIPLLAKTVALLSRREFCMALQSHPEKRNALGQAHSPVIELRLKLRR